MSSSIYLAVPMMAFLTMIQSVVLPRFPILGVAPQMLLVVVVAWGLLRGLEEGVVWAFVAGFLLDLFSLAPLGMSSLIFMLVVTVVVLLQLNLPTSRFLLPVLLMGLATLLYLFLYTLMLGILGHGPNWQAAAALLPLVILHCLLILPVYWFLYNLMRLLRPRPVEV